MAPHTLLVTTWAVVLVPWTALSVVMGRRATQWAFTPRWHGLAVPLFRVFFLASLPFEFAAADRPFIPSIYGLGLAGVALWLGARATYAARAPRPAPPEDSIPWNLAYVANLVSFALTMHSFACLAVLIHVSTTALLIRLLHLKRLRAAAAT